ncbi:MAG: histidinol dehydrogenase [bacterium]
MKINERKIELILKDVKRNGNSAVAKYIKKFDGVNLKASRFKISAKVLRNAYRTLSPDLRNALRAAQKNIASFYTEEKKQIVRDWTLKTRDKICAQKWIPVDSAGVYVPGGRFSYPSTVLHGAVPARTAGVKRVVCISPPGKITNEVLAAAYIARIDEFYQIGGPAGIAALSFGTKTIKPVDLIVGPGNVYVTAAKKLVYGTVGIDMLAGPSEVAIVADAAADIKLIMQDIKAQKEHDPHAHAWIISLNKKLSAQLKKMNRSARIITVPTIAQAAEIVNKIAPEHLQLMSKKNAQLAKLIRSAGAVFIGRNTPVAIGDYIAGPSHILPTGRTARFSSGLSICNFYKRINSVAYRYCSDDFAYASEIASSEGMYEHKKSLTRRMQA